ncbi:YfbU family protein [soil metagenome]
MATVKLTDVERLILANQYAILGLLKSDEGYIQMAENLRDGHKWLYEQHATQISDNLPDEDVEHVLCILGIHSDLRDSYSQLSDKSGIEEHLVHFPGFDGNNEADLLHFARALSRNGNYSETIGKEARNSHMPTTDMYRRMINEWKSMGEPRYPLSKETILRIVGARVHPDNIKSS